MKFLTIVNGIRSLVTAITVSAGSVDGNKIVATKSDGKLDSSLIDWGNAGTIGSGLPATINAYTVFFKGVTGYGGELIFDRNNTRTWNLTQQEGSNNLVLFRYPSGSAITALNLNLANGDLISGGTFQAPTLAVNATSGDASVLLRQDGVTRWSVSHSRATNVFYIGRFVSGNFASAPFQIDANTALTTISSGLSVSGGNGCVASQFRLSALNTAPASASATGTTGEIRIDASFIYVCVSPNSWRRAALLSW